MLGADDFLNHSRSLWRYKGVVQLSGFVFDSQKAIDKAGEIASGVKRGQIREGIIWNVRNRPRAILSRKEPGGP